MSFLESVLGSFLESVLESFLDIKSTKKMTQFRVAFFLNESDLTYGKQLTIRDDPFAVSCLPSAYHRRWAFGVVSADHDG